LTVHPLTGPPELVTVPSMQQSNDLSELSDCTDRISIGNKKIKADKTLKSAFLFILSPRFQLIN
jgi:hypothetical protein